MFRAGAIAGVVFSMFLGLGCGAPETLEPGEVDDTAGVKADGAAALRMGSYDISPDLGPFWALTLEENGNYTLRGGCKPNPTGPSCFAIINQQGHYRLTRSGSKKYLRLYNDLDGKLSYRLQYTVSGAKSETVTLVDMHTEASYTAKLQQADKSQEGESCGGFVATLHQCADGLFCKAAARCCDLPGVCVRQ
jgi:hypothetical protein